MHKPALLLLYIFILSLSACGEQSPPVTPGAGDPSTAATTPTVDDAVPSADPQAQTAQLYEWLDEVFQVQLERSPQFQTQLGMIDDLDAYGRWDDHSEEAAIEWHALQQGWLAEMRERFPLAALDDNGRTTYRFMEYNWEMADRLFQVRNSEYVFTSLLDPISGYTSFLINNHRVAEPAHAEAYVSRLQGISEVIDELISHALTRAEQDVRVPLFAYPRLIEAAQGQLQGAEFGNGDEPGALLSDFISKVEDLELDEADAANLIERAEAALREDYQPAMQRYIAALREMEAESDDRDGVWKLPGGEDFYAVKIAQFTTRDDLTAQEIHDIGLSEVARIRAEMEDIMRQVDFDGDLQDFFEFLRTDEQFYYPNTEEGRQRYLDESTEMIAQVMTVAPQYFNALPEAGLEVRAVEPFREATATGAFYNTPALDGSRPGYYYVNLANMQDNPTYLMESLAYHEGAPGHHFQLALVQEMEEMPMLQRLNFNSAYVEGWALYAERLGKDMGFFTDPYMDFGRLSYEIFRAVRLVVDTGIHHLQWTRDEAIDYMLANTPMTRGDIEPEVERYITWPAQALSYKIGMNTIMELREERMAALGDDFDWGDFHDAVLTGGSLPLPLLIERVQSW